MIRMPWSGTEPSMRMQVHGSQPETNAYGDQIQASAYSSIVSGTENLHYVVATHSPLLPRTIPPLGVAQTYDYSQLSPSSPTSHHAEFIPPQLEHPLYSPLTTESELSGNTPSVCRSLSFPQPSGSYNPWSSFHPPPHLHPNIAACGASPPTLHFSAFEPTSYPNSSCCQFPWPTGDVRVGSVDEIPPVPSMQVYDLPGFPPPNSGPSSHPNLDNTSEPYNGALDTPYPCQWTKGGVTCNVMVLASRSHMNRHLHAYHGFGGSDARQTRCYWAGCEAMMQQGSIARHMVTCHLQAKVTCPMCSKKLSRQDVISKHQRVCPAAGTWR